MGKHPRSSGNVATELLRRKQAAQYLNVSERTLAIWHSTGRYDLPLVKIGRLAMYRRSDLDAFIARRMSARVK